MKSWVPIGSLFLSVEVPISLGNSGIEVQEIMTTKSKHFREKQGTEASIYISGAAMVILLARNCFGRVRCCVARCLQLSRYSTKNESLAQFPGAQAAFTNSLDFLIPKITQGIPIYRVMGRDGKVIDESQEPNIAKEELVHMYKTMTLLNTMDKILYESQRQGRITGVSICPFAASRATTKFRFFLLL